VPAGQINAALHAVESLRGRRAPVSTIKRSLKLT
jgi:hypothetical protein